MLFRSHIHRFLYLSLGSQGAADGSLLLQIIIVSAYFLLGARSDKDLLQLEEFAKYGEVYTTTEDGSYGEKGYVTQHSILGKVQFEQIYTCGPKPMMMAVAKYHGRRRGRDPHHHRHV